MEITARKDRVVLITGAGRGIAKRIALTFAEDGDRIAVVDLVEERAKGTADEIAASGGAAIAIQCDVRDEPSVRAMVERVVDSFGRVDVLVNAAGGYTTSFLPSHETTEEEWDMVVDSNLKGTFLCCKAVIPHMMRNGGGKIINFSSNAGRTSSPVLGCHYTAAKAGVLGLTRHLAKEYASHNILVNTIAPGPARGERAKELLTEETEAALISQIPLKRLAEPEDIAGVVFFLASDAARFITGATLDVNGGYIMM